MQILSAVSGKDIGSAIRPGNAQRQKESFYAIWITHGDLNVVSVENHPAIIDWFPFTEGRSNGVERVPSVVRYDGMQVVNYRAIKKTHHKVWAIVFRGSLVHWHGKPSLFSDLFERFISVLDQADILSR